MKPGGGGEPPAVRGWQPVSQSVRLRKGAPGRGGGAGARCAAASAGRGAEDLQCLPLPALARPHPRALHPPASAPFGGSVAGERAPGHAQPGPVPCVEAVSLSQAACAWHAPDVRGCACACAGPPGGRHHPGLWQPHRLQGGVQGAAATLRPGWGSLPAVLCCACCKQGEGGGGPMVRMRLPPHRGHGVHCIRRTCGALARGDARVIIPALLLMAAAPWSGSSPAWCMHVMHARLNAAPSAPCPVPHPSGSGWFAVVPWALASAGRRAGPVWQRLGVAHLRP